LAEGDGLVAPKPLAHVNHAAAAFPKPLFELLALEREGADEGFAKTFGGCVTLDQDTFGFLEALRQRGSFGALLVLGN
jgi:hypothetical protein